MHNYALYNQTSLKLSLQNKWLDFLSNLVLYFVIEMLKFDCLLVIHRYSLSLGLFLRSYSYI